MIASATRCWAEIRSAPSRSPEGSMPNATHRRRMPGGLSCMDELLVLDTELYTGAASQFAAKAHR